MIFTPRQSKIIELNRKTNATTIRFDKGSPSVYLFSGKNKRKIGYLNRTLLQSVGIHPTQSERQLMRQIIDIERVTNTRTLNESQLTLTNGALSGLYFLLPLLLSRKGRIIVNDLCFEATVSLIESLNLIPVPVDYSDVKSLEKNIAAANAKILFLNSPENPSGKIYDATFLECLGYLAKKYGLIVISDEVNNQKIYPPHTYTPPCLYIPDKNLIVLNSFTKNYFLPGIRLGWITAEKNLISRMYNLTAIAQVGINYPSQIIASYVIRYMSKEIRTIKQSLLRKKLLMERELSARKIPYMNPVMAGSVIFVNTGKNSMKLSRFLREHYNIGSIPGVLFGKKWSKWMRLGFGCVSDSEIKKGISILAKILRK